MRICLFPRVGSGGPASFQARLADAFARSNIEVTYSPDDLPPDAVLVFAATRHVEALARCRRNGIRVVQRLDGIHWLHRLPPFRPGYFLRAELRNMLQRFIRRFLADQVIYQSGFVRGWWESWYGHVAAPACIIRNGIPLMDYPPRASFPDGTLLVVEGNLHHNQPTVALLREINKQLVRDGTFRKMSILGSVDRAWGAEWSSFDPVPETSGWISREAVKMRQLNAAAFLSAEINPPCPNAVMEAMAAGLPVIGLDTGALRELAGEHAVIVPFGGDPWRLESPRGISELAEGTRRRMEDWGGWSQRARSEAENKFDMNVVAAQYREVLFG
jgi:glycosyltransferase involved in cell wall biosynthesis